MKTIGIIGGGQLGLMIAEQARELGVRTVCLDPAADAPAFNVCDDHIVAAYDDAAALEELCRRSDAVTYEFENVPGDILIPLCGKYNIPQGFRPLYDSQDRLREKDNARANGLRTPLYAAVDDEASLRAALAEIGFPAVLKTRTLGYDGHGQLVLKDEADVPRALPMLSVPCILEAFVPFDFEASIVMVSNGERVIHFPIGRNVHRDGILDLCFVPAEGMDDGLRSRMAAATAGSSPSSSSSATGSSISTKWRRGPTIRGTIPSRGARPTSSASWCASCWANRCRSRSSWRRP